MKTKSLLFAGLLALIMTFMTACSGEVSESEEAMLYIDFNGKPTDAGNPERFIYRVNIDGPTSVSPPENRNGNIIPVKLRLGDYKISTVVLDSADNDNIYSDSEEKSVTIKQGPNNITIELKRFGSAAKPYIVSSTKTTSTDTPINITLATDTPGAMIYYRLNGAGSWILYTEPGPITIDTLGDTALEAYAVRKSVSGFENLEDSYMLTEVYTLNTSWTAVWDSTLKAIIFTFALSIDSLGLSGTDISLTAGTFAPEDLSGGTKTWNLPITISKVGSVYVNINKAGIKSGTQPVTIYYLFNGIEMAWISDGQFTMGSSDASEDGLSYPSHLVTLTKGFYMGKYEVTQKEYEAVMGIGTNPSFFTTAKGQPPKAGEVDEKRPVENVSWYDVLVFCNNLSSMESLDPVYSISGSTNPTDWGIVPTYGRDSTWDAVEMVSGANGYRLPTEAEWEYACRAGTTTAYSFGVDDTDIDDYTWYGNNSDSKTHEVGKKYPNAWGLYDMHGNVFEWCWDWLDFYDSGDHVNPKGPDVLSNVVGPYRVMRGGDWFMPAEYLRSVRRSVVSQPGDGGYSIGFRVVRP